MDEWPRDSKEMMKYTSEETREEEGSRKQEVNRLSGRKIYKKKEEKIDIVLNPHMCTLKY